MDWDGIFISLLEYVVFNCVLLSSLLESPQTQNLKFEQGSHLHFYSTAKIPPCMQCLQFDLTYIFLLQVFAAGMAKESMITMHGNDLTVRESDKFCEMIP